MSFLVNGECRVCGSVIFAVDGPAPEICVDHKREIAAAAAKGPDASLRVFASWEEKYGYNAFTKTRTPIVVHVDEVLADLAVSS